MITAYFIIVSENFRGKLFTIGAKETLFAPFGNTKSVNLPLLILDHSPGV